jgi:hypothetical protein
VPATLPRPRTDAIDHPHRPRLLTRSSAELKQFVVDLMCAGDGRVPLFLRVVDANKAGQAAFAGLLAEFKTRHLTW